MKVKPPREKNSSLFRSKKFLTYLIGIFIISLMVFSVMDLWVGSKDSYVYKNVKFTKDDRGWSAYIGNNFVLLPYSPEELENITLIDFSSFNSLQKVYLSTGNPLANYKSIDYFSKRIPLNAQKVVSCTHDAANVTECENLPLKDCEDANNQIGVIVFEKSESMSSTFISSSCLLINGNDYSLIKVFDKSMLVMLGA